MGKLIWAALISILIISGIFISNSNNLNLKEKEAQKEFGNLWDDYTERTPAFIPRLKKVATS